MLEREGHASGSAIIAPPPFRGITKIARKRTAAGGTEEQEARYRWPVAVLIQERGEFYRGTPRYMGRFLHASSSSHARV